MLGFGILLGCAPLLGCAVPPMGSGSGASGAPAVTVTSVAPRMAPTSAEELGIVLDDHGRPYDVEPHWDWQAKRTRVEHLGVLSFAGGHVRTMDGNALQIDPQFFADEAATVEFGPHEDLDLSVVWEQYEYEDQHWESILGVRLQVPDRTVARWEAFEYAYGTDGGVGAITSQAVIDDPHRTGPRDELFDWDYEDVFYLGDHDDTEGPETFVFSNGYGDGGFPMARGVDEDGETVALIVWDTRYPWRLAIDDGQPPPDVTVREDQFLECMAGTRLINEWGLCTTD